MNITTINGRIASSAWLNGKRFGFDGTTLGLVNSALAAGAQVGSVVSASFGGHSLKNARGFVVTPNGGGARTPAGQWAVRA